MPGNTAFFFNTYPGDFHLANRLIRQLKYYFPESDILAIPDGFYDDFCQQSNLENVKICRRETPLKRKGTVHVHSYQNLEYVAANTDAELIIQLDPDVFITQRFDSTNLPSTLFFGQFYYYWWPDDWDKPLVQGSVWGMRRSLLDKLVKVNPFNASFYEHSFSERRDGSSLEDRGWSESLNEVYPFTEWGWWKNLVLRNKSFNCVPRRGRIWATHPNTRAEFDLGRGGSGTSPGIPSSTPSTTSSGVPRTIPGHPFNDARRERFQAGLRPDLPDPRPDQRP